jgi:hypothetical protein
MTRRAALALAALLAAPCAFAVDLLVPAYFYPGGRHNYWPQLASAAPNASITAILNPASGPGASLDANYAAAVSTFQAAGGKAIGYVSTRYAARPLSEVTADINTYVALYPVQGFFIDEMTNDADSAHLAFYQSVYNYIKALNPAYVVVGNPGTSTLEVYASLPVADQLLVFEGSLRSYRTYVPAAWQAGYAANRFAHVIYGAGKSDMSRSVAGASARGAGAIFVTADRLPNPYDTLPSFWKDEVTDAAAAP